MFLKSVLRPHWVVALILLAFGTSSYAQNYLSVNEVTCPEDNDDLGSVYLTWDVPSMYNNVLLYLDYEGSWGSGGPELVGEGNMGGVSGTNWLHYDESYTFNLYGTHSGTQWEVGFTVINC